MTPPTTVPRSFVPFFSLFASLGTLVCCALPSLLVLVGLGTSFASLLAAVPWLVTLSQHKVLTFAVAGALLAAAWAHRTLIAPRLATPEACSADAATACEQATSVGGRLLWISTTLYVAGVFVAYGLAPILRSLDR